MARAKTESLSQRIAAERAAQKLWRPRAGNDATAVFGKFLESEFLTPAEQAALAARRLRGIVAYAAAAIPYYRDVLAQLKLSPEDFRGPESLALLPELDKAAIVRERARLRPKNLPKGERDGGSNTSSGTTGTPVRIYRSVRTRELDIIFIQRQFRWYRFDPAGSMAALRVAKNLPRTARGRLLRLGETVKVGSWMGVGRHFVTGPFLGFDATNPMADKVAWLAQVQPTYLYAMTGELEHLAFAFEGDARRTGVRGVRAASEPLTPGIEVRVSATFGAPVRISYGLDEVGWVASRCEAGRYHVHAERFIAEIVDEESKPCAPGEFGRVLVTDTANAAMPLLRYVTDDIAQALDGPCPCGRTLPSIGPIVGRHSQTKGLPAGTMQIVAALREAMERLPPELSRPVRQYQVRQTRAGDFELRLVLAGALAPGFADYIDGAWRRALAAAATTGRVPGFTVREVADIPRTPSVKFMHFVSEITRPREVKDYAPVAGGSAGTGS